MNLDVAQSSINTHKKHCEFCSDIAATVAYTCHSRIACHEVMAPQLVNFVVAAVAYACRDTSTESHSCLLGAHDWEVTTKLLFYFNPSHTPSP